MTTHKEIAKKLLQRAHNASAEAFASIQALIAMIVEKFTRVKE